MFTPLQALHTRLVVCGDVIVSVSMFSLHYHRSALEVVNKHWTELLREQDFLATPEGWEKMLALVPEGVRDMLDREWKDNPMMTSTDRWNRLYTEIKVSCFSPLLPTPTFYHPIPPPSLDPPLNPPLLLPHPPDPVLLTVPSTYSLLLLPLDSSSPPFFSCRTKSLFFLKSSFSGHTLVWTSMSPRLLTIS